MTMPHPYRDPGVRAPAWQSDIMKVCGCPKCHHRSGFIVIPMSTQRALCALYDHAHVRVNCKGITQCRLCAMVYT